MAPGNGPCTVWVMVLTHIKETWNSPFLVCPVAVLQ
jgi:hypothetical protein